MTNSSKRTRERTIDHGIARAHQLLTRGAQSSRRFSQWRLVIFLSGFFVCLFLYKAAWFHIGNVLLVLSLLLFFTVTHYHNRLKSQLHRLHLWQKLKQDNLARLRLDWQNIPPRPFSTPPSHPYAGDLDLTGSHSLLSLIDITFSVAGRERLIEWFLAQNQKSLDTAEWSKRQALVREITGLPLLRDRIVLESHLVSAEALDGDRIRTLVENPVNFPHLNLVLASSIGLCILTLLLLVSSVFWSLPQYWILSFGLYAGLYFFTAGHIDPIFGRVLTLQEEFGKFVAVVRLLEARSFKHRPEIQDLCAPLISHVHRPSVSLKKLARICHGLSVKAHPLIHLGLNAVIPWDLVFTHRLRRECHHLRATLPRWLDCLATLDAIDSLGNFAYLNPQYQWPKRSSLPNADSAPGFKSNGLGHPLIPSSSRVTNGIEVQGRGTVLLVTGSNMSGKSTFLRTIGVNICLAQAGAPVCADTFHWTWMRLFCCIRVTDSLEEGLSYFYAEVKRLKILLDATRNFDSPPVLFLIDEIYKGTNNRERLGGSKAFILALQTGNGLGLITTHDLELAQLETNGARVTNVHFQETVVDRALNFDYRLRSGPCPTTNALRIMANEGLPVPEQDQ